MSGCTTNHAGGEKGAVFELHNDIEERQKGIDFLGREDLDTLNV